MDRHHGRLRGLPLHRCDQPLLGRLRLVPDARSVPRPHRRLQRADLLRVDHGRARDDLLVRLPRCRSRDVLRPGLLDLRLRPPPALPRRRRLHRGRPSRRDRLQRWDRPGLHVRRGVGRHVDGAPPPPQCRRRRPARPRRPQGTRRGRGARPLARASRAPRADASRVARLAQQNRRLLRAGVRAVVPFQVHVGRPEGQRRLPPAVSTSGPLRRRGVSPLTFNARLC
mmetsp:Transcript_13751/g.55045  ORF Transcript_13751/g.55045 Transcript_13751/m.55045 type:complete len:226 (-) Transcript_13751:191-868(-)